MSAGTRGVVVLKVLFSDAEVTAANPIASTGGGAEVFSDALRIRRSEVHSIRMKVEPAAAISVTPRVQVSENGETGSWLEADPVANVVLVATSSTYEKVISISVPVAPFIRVVFPADGSNDYDVETLQVWALQT